jgi:aminoglycoside phosphotransferase (APT) family kinase protein
LGVTLDNRLLTLWDLARAAPKSRRATWLHGDPHPRNALGRDGLLSAVLDWGDVTAGDPASDLASLWMVVHDANDRRAALAAYVAGQQAGFGSDELEALVLRARGWALLYGVMHLASGLVDHRAHAAIGRDALRNVLADLPTI